MSGPYELRDYQLQALRKLTNGKILHGGVGSGKSVVAAEYYKLREAPRDVYVITTAKKRDEFDWQNLFYSLDIGPKSGPSGIPQKVLGRSPRPQQSGVGNSGKALGDQTLVSDDASAGAGSAEHRIGDRGLDGRGGRANLPRSNVSSGLSLRGEEHEVRGFEESSYPYVLTVDSWNNIAKYADVAEAFFIFDEQRLVGSGQWTRKFLRIAKRNHWILLSATPGDTWMDYVPVFVANNFYKNRSEFIREHVIYSRFTKFPKVERYINVGRLARHRSELLVSMPDVRHTRRRHVEVPLLYDKDALDLVLKKRWHVFEDRPLRDVSEMFSVGRRIVNGDPSRLEMVKELWQKHPKLIVFYNFNYELESLRSLTEYYGLSQQSKDGWSSSSSSTWLMVSRSNRDITQLASSQARDAVDLTPGSSGSTKNGGSGQPPKPGGSTVPGTTSLGPSGRSSKALVLPDARSMGISEWNGHDHQSGGMGSECQKNKDGLLVQSVKNTLTTNTPSYLLPPGLPSSSNSSSPIACDGLVLPGRKSSGTKSSTATTVANLEASSTTVAVGEWNGHKHQPVPTTDRWLYLVQYLAGAEAWECTETDATIFYSQTYSYKIYEQAQGRMDRMNTRFTDLWYYNFLSDSWVDRAIARSLKAKEDFNEAKFKGLFRS